MEIAESAAFDLLESAHGYEPRYVMGPAVRGETVGTPETVPLQNRYQSQIKLTNHAIIRFSP
jgi:hypothetical protein